MTLRFLLVALLLVAACDNKPKISAQDMKRTLQADIFDFNRDLNSTEIDSAQRYVGAGAEPAFEKLIDGYKNGAYNFFQTNDPPDIDYLAGEAKVVMHLFKGENKEVAGAKEIGKQVHLWKYVNGSWQWYGPDSQ